MLKPKKTRKASSNRSAAIALLASAWLAFHGHASSAQRLDDEGWQGGHVSPARYRVKRDELNAPTPAPGPKTPAQSGPARTRFRIKTEPSDAGTPQGRQAGDGLATESKAESPVSLGSFTAAGLQNETALTAIFRGDFDHLRFDGPTLALVLDGYLESFSQACAAYLPVNKVPLPARQCTVWRESQSLLGSDTCLGWEEVPSGHFADPELHVARMEVEQQLGQYTLDRLEQLFTGTGDTLTEMAGFLFQGASVKSDAGRVVSMNACGGPGLKRFGENLRRFARKLAPLKLDVSSGGRSASQ